MRDYTFTAECNSGQVKTFTFQSANYRAARTKLEELIAAN